MFFFSKVYVYKIVFENETGKRKILVDIGNKKKFIDLSRRNLNKT